MKRFVLGVMGAVLVCPRTARRSRASRPILRRRRLRVLPGAELSAELRSELRLHVVQSRAADLLPHRLRDRLPSGDVHRQHDGQRNGV